MTFKIQDNISKLKENSEIETIEEMRETEMEWPSMPEGISPPNEAIPNLIENINKKMDSDFHEVDNILAEIMVSQDLVKPNRLLRETKNFNTKKENAGFFYGIIQTSILGVILSYIGILISYTSNLAYIDIFSMLWSVLILIWLLSEWSLWRIVKRKVKHDERTVIGKILRPKPDMFTKKNIN